MKILSITAQKPHSTGSGTYMTELVRSFARAGCEQAVVCGIYPDDELSFPEGVSCYPVIFTKADGGSEGAGRHLSDAPRVSFPIVGMSDIMPYTSTRYRDLDAAMIDEFERAFTDAAGRAIDELDPDLIICHHLFLLTALIRKHYPERRIFGISHGTDLRQMVNCDNLRELVRPQIAKLDLCLALHASQAATIKELLGLGDERVKVIGSGYNGSIFNTEGRKPRAADEPVRICYAGKISRPKGVPELLDALDRLAADPSVPDFTLTMAGGCQDEALKGRLSSLPPYAGHLGQIPQPKLAELFKRSDVFVLPSYFEGLPLVLIEAMASGAVPVSTDLPGVREWIDANVKDPNVIYVPMPAMKSIDEPTGEGRISFTADLAAAVAGAIRGISEGRSGALPDTGGITWDRLASRILEFNF